MKNIDSQSHVRGESVYVDDITPLKGTLSAVVVGASIARGRILSFDTEAADKLPGIIKIVLANDIPGDNEIGGIINDEPLLAEKEIHYRGQPLAIILAESEFLARKARELISIEYEELEPIIDPRQAYKNGEIIGAPRTFHLGVIEESWKNCEYIIEDSVSISGQEHLYLETQGAYCFKTEQNRIHVISSTQGPTAVQRTIAQVLGLAMHEIEVDVRRLGGGFGGKEDQATPWACMAALGTYITGKPVKLILNRIDDMYMTGKRHAYEADFKIGFSKDGNIINYEVIFYQNAGAAADLSPAVLERTLFHATNSYFIPNVKATGISCRTNLPPNTAFRGFGGPQGMFVIEAAIAKVAEFLQKPTWIIQQQNLLHTGDVFPYGQQVRDDHLHACWSDALSRYNFDQLQEKVDTFNQTNKLTKKGLAVMPVTFGISFTNTSMNQAGALVQIYQDGSISLSTGAVEMGQGVNTRLLQVPAHIFGISPDLVRLQTTNTSRVANTSPSAASSTHDLNGKATLRACETIKERLLKYAAYKLNLARDELTLQDSFVMYNGEKTDLDWFELIREAHQARIDLAEHGFYATPEIYFDKNVEKGHPFAYHAIGTAIIEVTVDCLRGIYEFDQVLVTHDFGKSMNRIIDIGQMEGGIVQGLGWMTTEELTFDNNGILLSNSLSTYKIPDMRGSPNIIKTHFLELDSNRFGLFQSKAIGEPPLMYGIGGYFAIRAAIRAFNTNSDAKFTTPLTHEKVLMDLYQKRIQYQNELAQSSKISG